LRSASLFLVMLLPDVFRSDQEGMKFFHWIVMVHIKIGFSLTWIYRKSVQVGSSTLSQGIRFGIAIARLMTIPGYLIYLAVLKIPAELAHKQMLYDLPFVILLGVLVAFLNKKK